MMAAKTVDDQLKGTEDSCAITGQLNNAQPFTEVPNPKWFGLKWLMMYE